MPTSSLVFHWEYFNNISTVQPYISVIYVVIYVNKVTSVFSDVISLIILFSNYQLMSNLNNCSVVGVVEFFTAVCQHFALECRPDDAREATADAGRPGSPTGVDRES